MGHHKHCLSYKYQRLLDKQCPDEALMLVSPLPNREQQSQGQFAPTPLQGETLFYSVALPHSCHEPGARDGDTGVQSEHFSFYKN